MRPYFFVSLVSPISSLAFVSQSYPSQSTQSSSNHQFPFFYHHDDLQSTFPPGSIPLFFLSFDSPQKCISIVLLLMHIVFLPLFLFPRTDCLSRIHTHHHHHHHLIIFFAFYTPPKHTLPSYLSLFVFGKPARVRRHIFPIFIDSLLS